MLVLNSGSSSLKFALYRVRGADALRLLSRDAEGLGGAAASFHATDARAATFLQEAATNGEMPLAVDLDEARNQQCLDRVTDNALPCLVCVLPTQEDKQIARHTRALCGQMA